MISLFAVGYSPEIFFTTETQRKFLLWVNYFSPDAGQG